MVDEKLFQTNPALTHPDGVLEFFEEIVSVGGTRGAIYTPPTSGLPRLPLVPSQEDASGREPHSNGRYRQRQSLL
jgi:hypothetical protein